MPQNAKWEYFKRIYQRYQRAAKDLKGAILDEFCQVCGYVRKYAIAKLNGPPPEDPPRARKRKGHFTYSVSVIQTAAAVWEAAGFPCGQRLKALLPDWLPWIRRRFRLSPDQERALLRISARTLDSRLRPYKRRLARRLYGRTKPGALLKHHIPIKTDHWDVKTPGFTEIDSVSHSGNSYSGLFAHSLNQTDILTTWTETRAALGLAHKEVFDALDEMEKAFPFKILGIDSDNGSEFINTPLYKRCRKRRIQFTRGRPYKKDDNAHIEQKNGTHVRKIMGWNRYDTQAAVHAMNDLYKNELRLFQNLFIPSMKLKDKKRIGSKLIRRYDRPQTPFQRLLASGRGDPRKIAALKRLKETWDPFDLSKIIDRKLRHIWTLANNVQSPKPQNHG